MVDTGMKAGRSYSDTLFNPDQTSGQVLSLQIGFERLIYTILDPVQNRYLLLEEFLFDTRGNQHQLKDDLQSVLEGNDFLMKPYRETLIAFDAMNNILVPDALFDSDNMLNYLEMTDNQGYDQIILTDHLLNLKARNVFSVQSRIGNMLKGIFQNAKIRSTASAFIDGLALELKKNEGRTVVLNVGYGQFSISCFSNNELQLFNNFNYTTAEDLTYFTMFTLEQLGYDPDNIHLKLFGEFNQDSAIFGMLYKYIRNISFGERTRMMKYSSSFDGLPPHFFRALFQQYLCA